MRVSIFLVALKNWRGRKKERKQGNGWLIRSSCAKY